MAAISKAELENASTDAQTYAKYLNGLVNDPPNINRAGNDVENLAKLREQALEIASDAANLQTYLSYDSPSDKRMVDDTSQPIGTQGEVTQDADPTKNKRYTYTATGWVENPTQPAKAAEVQGALVSSETAYGAATESKISFIIPYRRIDRTDNVWQRSDPTGKILELIDYQGGRADVGRQATGVGSTKYIYPFRNPADKRGYLLSDRNGGIIFASPVPMPPVEDGFIGAGPMFVRADGAAKSLELIWQVMPAVIGRLEFRPNGTNSLFNFRSYKQAVAQIWSADAIDWDTIQETASDMFPPCIARVINNPGTPLLTGSGSPIYTGGNHGRDGGIGGGTTAETVSISLWADGRPISAAETFSGYLDTVRARWVNNVGTHDSLEGPVESGPWPRYPIRQTFDATFYPGGLWFDAEMYANEAFAISTDNGIQLFHQGMSTIHFLGGQQQGRIPFTPNETSGVARDWPAWAMIMKGPSGIHGCWYDREYGAGDGRYVAGSAGFFRNSNATNPKSYSNIVGGGGAEYTFQAGERYVYHGGIVWAADNGDGAALDCAFTMYKRRKLAMGLAMVSAGTAVVKTDAELRQREIGTLGFNGLGGLEVTAAGYETSINLVE